MRDSLGVPMEPYDKEVAEDWQGESLYEFDLVYKTPYGLVKSDSFSVREFMDLNFGDLYSLEDLKHEGN